MPNIKKSISSLPEPTEEQLSKMEVLTKEQKAELQEITYLASIQFRGQLTKLESAIGALHLGHHIGWKGLYIVHNKRTIRQFEEVLGINFREFFPESGPGSERLFGYQAALKFKKFWQVVSGDIKVEKKREIDK